MVLDLGMRRSGRYGAMGQPLRRRGGADVAHARVDALKQVELLPALGGVPDRQVATRESHVSRLAFARVPKRAVRLQTVAVPVPVSYTHLTLPTNREV